jgi:hypothetical protein
VFIDGGELVAEALEVLLDNGEVVFNRYAWPMGE